MAAAPETTSAPALLAALALAEAAADEAEEAAEDLEEEAGVELQARAICQREGGDSDSPQSGGLTRTRRSCSP